MSDEKLKRFSIKRRDTPFFRREIHTLKNEMSFL